MKTGCAILQPGASLRPVTTNRSWTPPSDTKRASRIGPFGTMNHGTVLVAPPALATAGSGLMAGPGPPAKGGRGQGGPGFGVKRRPGPACGPVGLGATLRDGE